LSLLEYLRDYRENQAALSFGKAKKGDPVQDLRLQMVSGMERATKDKTHGRSYTAALAAEARMEATATATAKRMNLKDARGPDSEVCKMYLDEIKIQGCYLGSFEISALQRVLTKEASSMGDIADDVEDISIVVWTLENLRGLGGTDLIPAQQVVGEDGRWQVSDVREYRENDCNLFTVDAGGKHYDFLRRKRCALDTSILDANIGDYEREPDLGAQSPER
jgi:hypothetical protein